MNLFKNYTFCQNNSTPFAFRRFYLGLFLAVILTPIQRAYSKSAPESFKEAPRFSEALSATQKNLKELGVQEQNGKFTEIQNGAIGRLRDAIAKAKEINFFSQYTPKKARSDAKGAQILMIMTDNSYSYGQIQKKQIAHELKILVDQEKLNKMTQSAQSQILELTALQNLKILGISSPKKLITYLNKIVQPKLTSQNDTDLSQWEATERVIYRVLKLKPKLLQDSSLVALSALNDNKIGRQPTSGSYQTQSNDINAIESVNGPGTPNEINPSRRPY